MTFQAIPGLIFNGKQVGYDDGVGVVVPAPVISAPATVVTTYDINLVNLDDALFLYRMDYDYRHRVGTTTQLHYDILTFNGKTYAQTAASAQPAFKTRISQVINLAGSDNSALASAYDVNNYTGPLKQIYINLVASKGKTVTFPINLTPTLR